MEDLSSPISIASSTPTAPTSASKVTYTTAGTPYNPSTSQPLQPPARRGRSLKWPAGLPTAGLSLLPKSVLATLPLKAGSRPSTLQQYSPQTPYDRASSPLNDTDHRCINMSAQVPRIVPSATPSPLTSLFSEAEQDTLTDVDASEESDEECELGMDPLMNMTAENPTLGRSFDDAFWNSQPNKSHSIPLDSSRSFNLAVGSNTTRAPGTMAPGAGAPRPLTAGAPRPLTAGPPGQRQYRPSTFESTFKALHTNIPSQDVKQDEDEDVLIITRQTLRQAGISNSSLAQNISSFEATASQASQTAEGLEGLSANCKTTRPSAPTTAATRGSQYSARGASSWGLGTAATSACWTSSPELSQSRYTSGPRFRAPKELQAYNNKINHAWYYGADFLVATPSEIALQVQPPKAKGQFGAIGDGRPSKKGEFHRRLEIEDANRMSVADHARPLFNMAHASVQQFIEGEWNKSQGRATVLQATK
ncbi:Uncharacterized protein Y057_13185 [Fusarium fujikuroi]|nr:Uncharacterized protein Y057_13185 [Fusarium fujikuroi]